MEKWEEAVMRELRAGYAEKGSIVDMVLIHEGDVTQVLQLQYPTLEMQKAALVAAREVIAKNRGHIEEVALVATVSRSDAANDTALMVLFETKKEVSVMMYKSDGIQLKEMRAGKAMPAFNLGLKVDVPDYGHMYR